MCKVAGCGKCFARGEHLKRHVRSIHTHEKREYAVRSRRGLDGLTDRSLSLCFLHPAHKCPYPGCGKDFSRHDNLGQHMRVHKGFSMPKPGRL